MHKYKLGLVILLVTVFAVPSQLIAEPEDQALLSPAIAARTHVCSITNVVDVQLQVTTILLDQNGAIQKTSTEEILPGVTRMIFHETPDLHLDRCTAEWFGLKDDIIGSICGIEKKLEPALAGATPIGITCVPMQ